MKTPMHEKLDGFGCDLPIRRIRQGTPGPQALPHFIDDWGWIVLLLLGRKALTLIEDNLPLVRTLPFLRFRDRRDELCRSPVFDDSLCRLSLIVQFPMSLRTLIGRIQNRMLEKRVRHLKFRLNVVARSIPRTRLVLVRPQRVARREIRFGRTPEHQGRIKAFCFGWFVLWVDYDLQAARIRQLDHDCEPRDNGTRCTTLAPVRFSGSGGSKLASSEL